MYSLSSSFGIKKFKKRKCTFFFIKCIRENWTFNRSPNKKFPLAIVSNYWCVKWRTDSVMLNNGERTSGWTEFVIWYYILHTQFTRYLFTYMIEINCMEKKHSNDTISEHEDKQWKLLKYSLYKEKNSCLVARRKTNVCTTQCTHFHITVCNSFNFISYFMDWTCYFLSDKFTCLQ